MTFCSKIFIMSNFANRFKNLRHEKGLSQQAIATIFCVDQTTISTWENGRREPSFGTLKNIAKYFKVTTDYLLGLED